VYQKREHPCPHAKKMIKAVKDNLGENVKIIDWTH
jgi:transcription antitermination factor NusA-like protein